MPLVIVWVLPRSLAGAVAVPITCSKCRIRGAPRWRRWVNPCCLQAEGCRPPPSINAPVCFLQSTAHDGSHRGSCLCALIPHSASPGYPPPPWAAPLPTGCIATYLHFRRKHSPKCQFHKQVHTHAGHYEGPGPRVPEKKATQFIFTVSKQEIHCTLQPEQA